MKNNKTKDPPKSNGYGSFFSLGYPLVPSRMKLVSDCSDNKFTKNFYFVELVLHLWVTTSFCKKPNFPIHRKFQFEMGFYTKSKSKISSSPFHWNGSTKSNTEIRINRVGGNSLLACDICKWSPQISITATYSCNILDTGCFPVDWPDCGRSSSSSRTQDVVACAWMHC